MCRSVCRCAADMTVTTSVTQHTQITCESGEAQECMRTISRSSCSVTGVLRRCKLCCLCPSLGVIRTLHVTYRHIQTLLEASRACLTGCNGAFADSGGCSKRSGWYRIYLISCRKAASSHVSSSTNGSMAAIFTLHFQSEQHELCGMQAQGGCKHGQCRGFRFFYPP